MELGGGNTKSQARTKIHESTKTIEYMEWHHVRMYVCSLVELHLMKVGKKNNFTMCMCVCYLNYVKEVIGHLHRQRIGNSLVW